MKWMQLVVLIVVLTGCARIQNDAPTLTLATTTSTRDSGLLDVLQPMFEQETGIALKAVAVGSGQALELGRRGDADVLLTHAPAAEEEFMAAGYGEQRRAVMHNDFVLAGPASDPAGIKEQMSITEAFGQIARSKSAFISRGDDSGTHMKEQEIWQAANIDPQGDWYVQAGAGMAEVLRIASEKHAYTLADRGTFLSQRDRLHLTIRSAGDPLLRNPYTVIVISAAKHGNGNREAAQRFSDFLVSPKVQHVIEKFGVERFGQPLFFPDALPEK